ncbi:energy transducer TonB family protein [Fusobacterium pseudoperiodonticum]|uniref:energy transducer TonB family protein n=1 Tax=Fusobacterium pseudoperiodonticum TaxID=2663009 RepID=UPI000C1B4D93|nr:energy transducer TonB [Fusobacterium pseudoperiodonticum]ATV56855.1 energy transducer TonB [Fusobacterium pseudoperiodonticum]PIM78494.1 energy transducer TonB [Fusobacterium pseudoperiodonticum]
MKKYVLISLIVHLAILFLFATIKTDEVEKEKLVKNEVVPIAFVAKQTSDNPGAKTLDTQEREKPKEEKPKSEPKIEKKVEEKKVEEKKPVEKPIEKKAEKTEEKKIESNISSKEDTSHSDNSSKSSSESSSTSSSDKSSNHSSDGGSPNGNSSGEDLGSNFIVDGDGTNIALTSEGINYQIINEVEPDYPSQAESIGYSKKVQVTVKFLVGLKGNVEKAEIIKSHKDLGFDAEVMKAIKKWKFKPIFHKGKNIKVYFTKTFVFEPQQ